MIGQQHMMVDIETLGNQSGSVITSIAAVPFTFLSGVSSEAPFYRTIDVQSCLDVGLKVTGSTLQWWFEQDPAVAALMFKDTRTLGDVLYEFRKYIELHGGIKLHLWGKSPRFDLGKIEAAYEKLHLVKPWNFRRERDVRTLIAMAPEVEEMPRIGNAHDPLSDCLTQIAQVRAAWEAVFAPAQ